MNNSAEMMKRREQKRLEKELEDMRLFNQQKGAREGVIADSLGDNVNLWEGRIQGPTETPYHRGRTRWRRVLVVDRGGLCVSKDMM